jgi:hypothetical protein
MAGWQEELRALATSLGRHVRRQANAIERLVDREIFIVLCLV